MDEECPYCEGTGLAPGDGKTKCGFCEDGMWAGFPLLIALKEAPRFVHRRPRRRKV